MAREGQETNGNPVPKEVVPSLRVEIVSKSEMERIKSDPPDGSIKVNIGTWVETDGKTPLINTGAGPCLVVYAVNIETGHVISGHFPEVDDKKQEMFTKQDIDRTKKKYPLEVAPTGIAVPNEEETRRLSYVRTDRDYEEFLRMKKRIEEWGGENTEVFLFGNNSGAFGHSPEEYDQRVIRSAIAQHDVLADLYKLGIPYSQQHDYRVPGEDNVDDTFYSPDTKTIKHSVRDHWDDGRYWLNHK